MSQLSPRLLFAGGCLLLLTYGLVMERHTVRSLRDESEKQITGPAFVEGATVDGYLRREDWLYDVYSLSPLEASQKDCKT